MTTTHEEATWIRTAPRPTVIRAFLRHELQAMLDKPSAAIFSREEIEAELNRRDDLTRYGKSHP